MINDINTPVRKITKNYRSITGMLASKKLCRSVAFESSLERSFFLALEFDSTVKSYTEQPLQIKLSNKTSYHPDCLVVYHERFNLPQKLIEVKYTQELNSKQEYFEKKFIEVKEFAAKNNMIFEVFTEQDISKTKSQNLLFLHRFLFTPNDTNYDEYITSALSKNSCSISDLLKFLSNNQTKQAEILPYIWSLIGQGVLDVDFEEPIGMNSKLRLAKCQ